MDEGAKQAKSSIVGMTKEIFVWICGCDSVLHTDSPEISVEFDIEKSRFNCFETAAILILKG